MELTINGHNMEVTQRLSNYVEKKTSRLDRYMSNLMEVHVDLSAENTRNALERQVAQITIRDTRGTILRAEERSNDMFASIDAVVDKLYRQIDRYRGKRKRKWRGGNGDEVGLEEALPMETAVEEDDSAVVRHKRFPVHPMSEEEAIEQMELLGHDFFVFLNVDVGTINVVYRRRDNNYGVLQPVLD